MGCAQSKIDNEESVARCKDRRNIMKDAVVSRNAFAAAHSAFSVSLKNIGAALSDYGHGEAEATLAEDDDHHHQSLDATPPPPPPPPPPSSSMENLPPPPPPLPEFSPSPVKRTVSLPAIPLKNRKYALDMDNCTITEDNDEEEEEEDEEEEYTEVEEALKNKNKNNNNGNNHDKKGKNVGGGTASTTTLSPRTPETRPVQNMAWDYFFNVEDHHHHLAGTSMATDEPNTNNVDSIADNININININKNTDNVNVNDNVKNDSVNSSNNNVVVNEPEKVAVEEREIIEHAKTAPPEFSRRSTTPPTSATVNLMQVLNQIDDQFLKASQTAQEVSNLLEATRMHYHSNFADNRATIDHSRRVMHAITWNRSFKGIPNGEVAKDYDSEEYETHATVLDKLLAWEKKLYEEVKQGELIKLEYHRKVAMLNKLKKRGATTETMEKTKAAVSHLHTKYIVDMQSLDSTVSEVNRLRDEQLYPKLVALVDGMAKMWRNMCIHHDKQHELVSDLKSLDATAAPKETTKQHHERTIQLHNVVLDWNSQFEKLVMHQKQYIQALNSWLKLNLIPIESSLKEKILSPPRAQNPRIQALLHSWHDYLERLQDDLAISAISSFAGVIKNIIFHQEEEMKLKEKCEETRKEYLRKNQAFEDWYHKYQQRRTEAERGEDVNTKDPVSEKQFAVESLKKRLEEEIVAHQRHCTQVREKSLGSLKTRLPELFHALSVYAHACSDAYEKLRSIPQSNGGSS